ncbi:MAG: SAM-dependent methyltransferase [Gammaproteobacteria bacterium]|jgi:SAM-dependent methyltransferase|nr:SAM-dependent methyltransferase [Gammaproteobacteria bacterium]
MPDFVEKSRLISHTDSPIEVNQLIEEKLEQIIQEGDKPYVTLQQQIEILYQLADFDFGRFLLQNQGINGYWTHYMLTYPLEKNNSHQTDLEKFLLECAPTVLATQERFKLFLKENQKTVENNKKLACIPCGMMGELLYLNFSEINSIQLIGIDYDASTLEDAKKLAKEKNLLEFTTFKKSDAWDLNLKNEFDLISSNGLNIYEPNNEKVIALYQQFYTALKPNGKLVTSFLTPPPGLADDCEWNMKKINPQDLLLQKIIFTDILNLKFQCFRSTKQTTEQLESVGFKNICFIPDTANLFPTVTAIKPQE